MRKTLISMLVMECVTIMGCHSVRTVDLTALKRDQEIWNEPKVSIWYYMGTRQGYHYFVHEDLPRSIYYRVSAAEMTIEHPMPYTLVAQKWQVMHWGIHAKRRDGDLGTPDASSGEAQ
jgi:uncharacterized protein YceK